MSLAKRRHQAPNWFTACCQRCVISLLLLVFPQALLQASPVNYLNQSIRIAMLQEPPNLNSMKMTDLVSYFLLGHVTEGLLRYDRRGRLEPGVAESWTTTDTSMTFKLRADARWSDGKPVTAHDFVFAWRHVNDPASAAPFAAIMYPIKNAEAVQKGLLPVESLGVSAPDDHTLVVQLERPCGYCLSLMPHGTFFPVREDFYKAQGEDFGGEAEHLLYNGPFSMTSWVHESSVTLQKNPDYWNQAEIRLNTIEIAYITSDNRTRLNLFRDDQIAFARLDAETVKEAVDQGMKVRTFLSGGVAYVWFNMREGAPMANRSLRRAIQLSFDGHEYVNQVVAIPGYKPTRTLFPSWVNGMEKKFVEEFPPPEVKRDLPAAKAEIEKARTEIGDVPPLTILTVSSPTGTKVAEYFQGFMKQSLGLDTLVDQQSFKQYLVKARQGQFDLVLSSWYPDFDDLVTYADLLASYNANNRGRFVSPEYDQYLRQLQVLTDPRARFEAAAELQRIIVQEVPVLPTAETGSAYVVHPRLRGMLRRVIGQDPDFTHARVLPP